MGKLNRGRSNYDLVLDPDGDRPVGLMLDKDRKQVAVSVRYLPTDGQGITVRDWTWQNGAAGAGYSVETPESRAGGGCAYGEFVCLCYEGRAMPAGALTEYTLPAYISPLQGEIRDSFEWGPNQDLWLTTKTRYMMQLANGTAAPVGGADFGVGVETESAAIFRFEGDTQDRAYVGTGTTGTVIRVFDGSLWSPGNLGTSRKDLAVVYWQLGEALATGGLTGTAGIGGHRLIGVDEDATGFYAVSGNPADTANWTALTTVGETGDQHPIKSIVASNRVVWFAKATGIYSVDELGHSPNVTSWVKLAYDPDNGDAVAFWDGLIWYAHRWGMTLVPVDGNRQDSVVNINFGYGRSNTTPVYGRVAAMAPSQDGMWVAYYNGTDSYIGKCRVSGGQGRWSMAECVIPDQRVTFLRQTSPGGSPRLIIGTVDDDGLMHLYWQSLSSTGDAESDHLHDGDFVPAPEWSLTFSEFDDGDPVEKTFRRYSLEARNLGGGNTVEYQLSADNGDFAVQGVATEGARWSGTPLASYVRATAAQVKLVCRNEGAAPIVIKSVGARYSPHPELTAVVTYPVIFGKGVPLNGGGVDTDDAANKLALLELYQRDDPITYTDHLGRDLEGIVEPGLNETYALNSDGSGWVVRATLTMSITRRLARFDVSLFDVDIFA